WAADPGEAAGRLGLFATRGLDARNASRADYADRISHAFTRNRTGVQGPRIMWCTKVALSTRVPAAIMKEWKVVSLRSVGFRSQCCVCAITTARNSCTTLLPA